MEPSIEHSFELTTFKSFTYCNVCNKLLWGVVNQGYTCTKCGLNVHESCRNVPSLCNPNSEKKENSTNERKNSFSASNFIKVFQDNNNKLITEASQKLQNTKILVKDKISHINNQNETINNIENQEHFLSNDIKPREILNANFKEEISQNNNNSTNSNNSTEKKNKIINDMKSDLLNNSEHSNNILENSKNKKKKLHKNKKSSGNRDIFSDSEEIIRNNKSKSHGKKRVVSSEDVKQFMIFSEPEDISIKSSTSSLFKRKPKKQKSANKEYASDSQSYDDLDSFGDDGEIIKDEILFKKRNKKKSSKQDSNNINTSNDKENKNKKESLKFFYKKKKSNTEDNSSTEINLDQSEEKITDIEDNDDIKLDKLEGTNSSIQSLSNFKTSELTEIIKESSIQEDEEAKKKLLKSKPSQSEICTYSIVVTSNNKSSSVDSNLSDSILNNLDIKENENDNKKENEISSNENSNENKNSVGFKLKEKNNSESKAERKKEYIQNNKKSKSMAALMKTNQVHSKLEQLLKSETFSFQNKSAESESEPLSLFSTTPKNTIVFATKIGPVFDLQDKFLDLLNWTNPSKSFAAYLIYSILCFKPNLILYIPVLTVVLFLAYIYYRKETGYDNPKDEKERRNSKKDKDKDKDKEKEKEKDMLSNLNNLFSSLSVKQKAAFNPNMVDMKTLQGNIQRLQNMMGSYCSMYDSVVEIWEKLNSTDSLDIRKALFFAILGLLGQIIALKFIRIGIILFLVGTFAFFPHFSIFIIWVLTGWIKIALEKINDIIMITQNSHSNSRLHYFGKKLIKPISEQSSDSESVEYSTNSQRARLYSTIENNELKVQKSVDNSKVYLKNGVIQNVMEGKIFTAIVVENQRWWVGTGFTDLLLHKDPPNYSTNYKDPKEALPSSLDNYPLPPNYRFIPDESWEIEMYNGDGEGWIYMDNVWKNEGPRKLTSYTRKRIWKRTATFYT